MEVEILRAAQVVVKKRRRCAESPDGDHAVDDRDLRGPRDRPAVGVLRGPAPPRRPLSTRGRRNGPATDSRGDEQAGDLWLSPRLGDGESHLPDRLQPQAHSAGPAAARPDAGAPDPPSPRAPASRADPAAGLESALV